MTALPARNPDDLILNRFAFHPANPDTGPKHDVIRLLHGDLAAKILEIVPSGRHQSLALTALQESMMWCNAGIACDSPVYEPDRDEIGEPPAPGTPLSFADAAPGTGD
jgi:hypothetical protein